jgi:hypothetical protein
MLSYRRALRYRGLGTCLNVPIATSDIANERRWQADVFVVLVGLMIAGKDGSCTLYCLGGSSNARESDARDD